MKASKAMLLGSALMALAACTKQQQQQPSTAPSSRDNGAPVAAKGPLNAEYAATLQSAPEGWVPREGFTFPDEPSGGVTARGGSPEALQSRPQCQPFSNGCNSCCNNGISGAYYRNSDCSYGCAMACGSQPCY